MDNNFGAIDDPSTGNDFGAIDDPSARPSSAWEKMKYAASQTGHIFGAPLESVAKIGRFANEGNQRLAELMAEKAGELQGRTGIPGLGTAGAVAGTALGTASEALMPQNKLSAGIALLPAVVKGVQAVKGMAKVAQVSNKPGVVAQAIKAYEGLSPGDAQFAIDNLNEVDKAKSVAEASNNYGEAVGGLVGKVKSIGNRLNKTAITAADYRNAVDRAGRLVNGTELDEAGQVVPLTPQDALEGVQTINQALRWKQYTQEMAPQQMAAHMGLKDKLMDFLEQNGAPKIREAARALRAAYIKEDFSSWVPLNKMKDPSVLRAFYSALKLGSGIAKVGAGNIPGGAMDIGSAAIVSPKVGFQVLKEAQALTKPAVRTGAQVATMGAANRLSKNPKMEEAANRNGYALGQ